MGMFTRKPRMAAQVHKDLMTAQKQYQKESARYAKLGALRFPKADPVMLTKSKDNMERLEQQVKALQIEMETAR